MPDNKAPKLPIDQEARTQSRRLILRMLLIVGSIFAGIISSGVLIIVFALTMAYPNLPELDAITSYRPKMPLRVFSADNMLIAEFGEERRNVVRFAEIPEIMKKAVLAIEDDRFYEHGGVDYLGIARATLHNLTGGAKQGASTITLQESGFCLNFVQFSTQAKLHKFSF